MAKNENVKLNEDGTADITLSRPIEISGTKVSAFRMSEPTVQTQLDMDAAKGSDVEKEIGMFANLCMQSPADIKRLPLRDYKRLQAAFDLFTD